LDKTLKQYDVIVARSREIFFKKTKDYGTSWRVLRPSSLTDQMYIKACRIRSLEEKAEKKVDESIDGEFLALVNYGIIVLIQLSLAPAEVLHLGVGYVKKLYDQQIRSTRELMIAKNHDYGEAWRGMRISSLTDMILMKLLRIKQIEDNKGKTLISEGLEANFQDIINYAIFALIKLSEEEEGVGH
jgi:Nucleotide modification associated domain 1